MTLFGDEGDKISPMLEDATGKELPALVVYSLALRYLKEDFLIDLHCTNTEVNDDDIFWVLTVPAIWNDAGKSFMREAANKAGISQLAIALESEAAYLYCRHLPGEKNGGESNLSTFEPATKYLVLDAGGVTVATTIHQVTDNGIIKELLKASGGAWGGEGVDDAFKQFIIKLVGAPVLKKFMKNNKEKYFDLLRDFENKKRTISPKKDGKISIRFPIPLTNLFTNMTDEIIKDVIPNSSFSKKITFLADKLRIDVDIIRSFYDESIRNILDHLEDLFQKPEVRGCAAIIMVGGFSGSLMLQEAIKSTFSKLRIIVPVEPGLAILKGAVIFGFVRQKLKQIL